MWLKHMLKFKHILSQTEMYVHNMSSWEIISKWAFIRRDSLKKRKYLKYLKICKKPKNIFLYILQLVSQEQEPGDRGTYR